MEILSILDLIGVAAFSVSGTVIAMKKKLDLLGIFIISAITAMGGGILRDVIMNTGIPVFFQSYNAIVIILVVTTFTILTRGNIKWNNLLFTADAIGLAVFAVDAALKGVEAGYNFPSVLFVGLITSTGGGVTRDILCQRVPIIFRKEVYATAALGGTIVLYFLYPHVNREVATYLSLAVVVILRFVTFKYKINLPSPQLKEWD